MCDVFVRKKWRAKLYPFWFCEVKVLDAKRIFSQFPKTFGCDVSSSNGTKN
jgi:hypothetical protein